MEAVITTLIGLVGGLALSVALWYWLTHIVSPRVVFSRRISRIRDSDGERRYRVKITNPARRREVIDLSYAASIEFPGLQAFDEEVASRPRLDLRSSKERTFRLPPGGHTVVAVSLPDLDELRRSHAIRAIYPAGRDHAGLGIETLLADAAKAYVRLQVLCNDGWSGARRYFTSPEYTLELVKDGDFDDE